MGLGRGAGKETMKSFRFVVREPKWVKVIGPNSTFPKDGKKYSHVLRSIWSSGDLVKEQKGTKAGTG